MEPFKFLTFLQVKLLNKDKSVVHFQRNKVQFWYPDYLHSVL